MKFFHDMIFFSFMLYLGGEKNNKNKQETKTQQIRVAYQPPFQGN